MPVISVILPTRDRPALVGRALASVLQQAGADFEVVLVDNNQAVAAVVTPADARVRVVRAPDATSAAAARNAGLKVARGEWVTFLDDDDEYAPDKLARQLALATATGAPLVLCGYVVPRGPRRRVLQSEHAVYSGDDLLLAAIWGTPFLFLRREPAAVFDEDLAAGEDIEFAQAYVRRHGLTRVPCVPAPLVIVHPQPGVRVNTRGPAHWRAARRVVRRHGAHYSPAARRRFLLRALLQRHKSPGGSWRRLLSAGGALLREGGAGEFRRVANACLLRTNLFNRWLVS
jgi:glycosyltransferase involved in cell wall biosynthesis